MSSSLSQKQKDNNSQNMKQFLTYILAACFLFVAISCDKSLESEKEKPASPTLKDVALVPELLSITATTATFNYGLDLSAVANMPLEVMLRYSVSESFPAEATDVVRLKLNESSITLTGLQFDRQYFYEFYITLYGTEYSADKKGSFATKKVEFELSTPVENADEVVISGVAKGLTSADLEDINVKLNIKNAVYGTLTSIPVEFDKNMAFTHSFSGLEIGTNYEIWVSAVQNKVKEEESDKMLYVTNDPYISAEKTFTTKGTNLSSIETANCYIVNQSGVYSFKLAKAGKGNDLSGVKSVRVLWETFGSSIAPKPLTLICATGVLDDYAVFEVPTDFPEGNAVIAAYNEANEIVWSWHIWLTKDEIVGENYHERQENGTYGALAGVVMDRNLGALSKDPNSVEAFGLMYQWGRKDPFMGSAYLVDNSYAAATRSFNAVLSDAEHGNLEYAAKNPNVFIAGNKGGDWLTEKNNSLWNDGGKTVNDPCPPGWRIPDGGTGINGVQAGLWAKIGLSPYGKTPLPEWYQHGWKGMTFQISDNAKSSWYPLAGGIGLNTELKLVGVDGTYWTNLPVGGDRNEVFAMNFYITDESATDFYAFCSAEIPRATGNSVRCCKE